MSDEEAKDALEAYESMPRYLQLRQPMGEVWRCPPLTPEQQAAQDAYIKEHKLPF